VLIAQVPTYGDPGESGISDTAIILIVVAALILVPIVVGLLLRLRDRHHDDS
jgi:hypothetical protein